MKSRHLFLFLIFLTFWNASSQACGGGILTLNIYTINGEKKESASYEIFPLPKEMRENYNYPGLWGIGCPTNDFWKNDIPQDAELTDPFNKILKESLIPKSGKFSSTLKFKTRETRFFPIIIRIVIKNQTMYIVGNYFGGCDREVCLLWDGKFINLK